MNRLKNSCVYLVGPMDNAGKDRGSTWRKEITPFLNNLGIGVLDPTNKQSDSGHEDKDHVDERQNIIDGIKSGHVLADSLYDKYHEIMREIVAVDLRMVDLSDFIIMYVNRDIFSCGTFHEMATAVLQRKPIIVMSEQGKVGCTPWIFGVIPHRMIFGSWEEVRNYINHIDSSETVDTLNRWRFYQYDKIFSK